MGIFGFGRKEPKIIDLTEREIKTVKKTAADIQSASESPLGFLGNLASSSDSRESNSDSFLDITGSVDEKRKKLARRLIDMTEKIEDMSNQIYHLQQRIEFLERKLKVGID